MPPEIVSHRVSDLDGIKIEGPAMPGEELGLCRCERLEAPQAEMARAAAERAGSGRFQSPETMEVELSAVSGEVGRHVAREPGRVSPPSNRSPRWCDRAAAARDESDFTPHR